MTKAPHIPIVDEWKVIRDWLRDDAWNVGLSDIFPQFQTPAPGGDPADRDTHILRRPGVGDHTDLPTLDILFLGDTGSQTAEPLEVDYETQAVYQVDRYTLRVRFDVNIGTDQELLYDGVLWKGTPTTLNVIRKAVGATLAKPDGYTSSAGSGSSPGAVVSVLDARRAGTFIREDIYPNIDQLQLYYNFTIEERRPYIALGP